MNQQNIDQKSKDYPYIKKLIIEGKHEEAHQLIDKFMKEGDYSKQDNLRYNLLKCDILYQQGIWEELIKVAKQTYQKSLELEDNLLSIDALLKLVESFIWYDDLRRYDLLMKKIEDLLKSQSQEYTREYKQREANLYTIKGLLYAWNKSNGGKAIEYFDQSIELHHEYSAKIEAAKSSIFKAYTLTFYMGDLDSALELLEEYMALLKENNNKFLIALGIFVRGLIYMLKGDLDRSLKSFEQCNTIFIELNNDYFTSLTYSQMSLVILDKGDLDKALEYAKISSNLVQKTNYIRQIGFTLQNLAIIYEIKGELDKSINFHEKSLEAFKKIDYKVAIAIILNNMSWNYNILGDSEKALQCIKSSIKINNELGILRGAAANYDYFIRILLDKGDLEQAKIVLKEFEQMKNQLKDEHLYLIYKFNEALVLKKSNRSRDRGKAEETLKQLIKNDKFYIEIRIGSLLNLCELLLTELSITNDLEVLEEINSFTAQLLDIAEKTHSFSLFAEIYFLKAKLALLTLDIKNARRFLTQAQKIAEKFGLNQLATKISSEHKNLVNQINKWENLKNTEISLAERIKLAGLHHHMNEILKKSTIISSKISEYKVTIHKEHKTCLVCKSDALGYMYTCQCGAVYCGKCAQALTDLENVCWVCNAPIDVSKPIKPFTDEKFEEKDILKKINKDSKKQEK